MSFKQYWKAEDSLPRIPASAGSKRLPLLSQCAGSGPEVRKWEQVRGKAEGGKRIRSAPPMTPGQPKQMIKSWLPKIRYNPASSGAKEVPKKGLWAVGE